MTDFSVTQYNPYNMYQNYGYSPAFKGTTVPTDNAYNNVPHCTKQSDTVTLANKQPISQQKKTLLTLGGIATAMVGAVLAVKGYRSHQITKGLEQIEQKFLKLQENMSEVQKTFKDVFLRGDITEKEALEMLNRYKEVEKIRVTGTKEEYARALFDEAKRNYGFANSNLKCDYYEGIPASGGGGFAITLNEVHIGSNNPIERLMNVIHHELRHAKQAYYGINLKPEEYLSAIREARRGTVFERIANSFTPEDVLKPFGMTKPNKNVVSNEYKSLVDDVIRGEKAHTYTTGERGPEYWNNFLEVDARSAGESMAKLFGLMAK